MIAINKIRFKKAYSHHQQIIPVYPPSSRQHHQSLSVFICYRLWTFPNAAIKICYTNIQPEFNALNAALIN